MFQNLESVGVFAILSLFITNFVMKYADVIMVFIFEYTFIFFGKIITFSNDQDETRDYEYINNYITNNAYCVKRNPRFIKDSEVFLYNDLNVNITKEQFHNYVGTGPFIVYFKKYPVLGYYISYDGQHIGFNETIFKKHTIKLLFRNNNQAKAFIEHSRDTYNEKYQKIGLRYKYSVGNQRWAVWKNASFNVPKTNRFSKNQTMIDFEEKIKEFIKNKQDYLDLNIPYKKTFLLHGPPGTGKSRFTKAIARTHNIPVHEASIGSGHISDTSLKILVAQMESGIKMLLLDEFDCIKTDKKNKKTQDQKMDGVSNATEPSKAGWNNLLDGEAYNGLIVVCITNLNIAQLRDLYGDSFLRKGRFDHIYPFLNADRSMIEDFLEKIDVTIDNEIIDFLHLKIGMSHLQTIYVQNYKCKQDIESEIIKLYNTLKNNREGTNIITDNPITNVLKENSLEEYSTIFYGRKIRTIDQFKLLSDQNLKDDLGIPLGDRLVFNHIINRLKEEKDKKDE